MKQSVRINVNGEEAEVILETNRTLLEVLREDLSLTGTKCGCDTGDCGACAVLLDGKPCLSCLKLAVDVQGNEIITIEGLGQDGKLDALQKAFIEKGAFQCGFCTPGMILICKALLNENARPTAEDVKNAISGNLCRCGSYDKIVEAVLSVANYTCVVQ
jgi:carbon-monoxide dehydrogenase small subunit